MLKKKKKRFHLKKKLRSYQKDALDFLIPRRFAGLFMEMRLGKSLTILRKLNLRRGLNRKKLIVAPNSALGGWISEVKGEGGVLIPLTGNKKNRRALWKMKDDHEYFFINPKVWQTMPELGDYTWDAVIVDEAHFLKDPKTKQTKFFLKKFRNCFQRFILTGTPIATDSLDLICPLKFLLGDEIPFDFWGFRAKFTRQYGYKTFIYKQGKQILEHLLKENIFSLTREEAGVEVPHQRVIREVELPPKIRKRYETLEDEFFIELAGNGKITKHAIQQHNYLHRLCGGFLEEEGEIHNAKIKELLELLRGELKGEKAIIWARYTGELLMIKEALEKKKFRVGFINGDIPLKKRLKIEEDFKKGKYDYLVLQPETVKQGIDFSTASISIYYSLPRGFITWQQSKDRILSLSKAGGLLTIILQIKDSVEKNSLKGLDSGKTEVERIFSYKKEKQC